MVTIVTDYLSPPCTPNPSESCTAVHNAAPESSITFWTFVYSLEVLVHLKRGIGVHSDGRVIGEVLLSIYFSYCLVNKTLFGH